MIFFFYFFSQYYFHTNMYTHNITGSRRDFIRKTIFNTKKILPEKSNNFLNAKMKQGKTNVTNNEERKTKTI